MPHLDRLDKKADYDGQEKHELGLDTTDYLTVHPIRSKPGLYGLHVANAQCDNVISLWGMTDEQLRQLYDDIGRQLGLPPLITLDQLRDLHKALSGVIQANDNVENGSTSPFA